MLKPSWSDEAAEMDFVKVMNPKTSHTLCGVQRGPWCTCMVRLSFWSLPRLLLTIVEGVLASEYATVSLEGSHQHRKRRTEVELEFSLLKKGLAAPFEKGESVEDWLTYMLK